jgi:hypothetical protein
VLKLTDRAEGLSGGGVGLVVDAGDAGACGWVSGVGQRGAAYGELKARVGVPLKCQWVLQAGTHQERRGRSTSRG